MPINPTLAYLNIVRLLLHLVFSFTTTAIRNVPSVLPTYTQGQQPQQILWIKLGQNHEQHAHQKQYFDRQTRPIAPIVKVDLCIFSNIENVAIRLQFLCDRSFRNSDFTRKFSLILKGSLERLTSIRLTLSPVFSFIIKINTHLFMSIQRCIPIYRHQCEFTFQFICMIKLKFFGLVSYRQILLSKANKFGLSARYLYE